MKLYWFAVGAFFVEDVPRWTALGCSREGRGTQLRSKYYNTGEVRCDH